MFHFLPLAIRYDGSAPAGGHGYQVHIGPMYSDARGSVKITLDRPARAPGAALQLPVDGAGPPRVGRGGPRARGGSSASRRSQPFNGGEISPGPAVETDEQILDWVRATPRRRCTRRARAGWAGEDSVVDPATMGVHGLEGLRVVDASVMPYVTNGKSTRR